MGDFFILLKVWIVSVKIHVMICTCMKGENPMKKGKKRYLTVVLLLSAMVMGTLTSCGGGSKTIAEIPDPIYYYDIEAEVEELSKDEKIIRFYSDEHLWGETAGYINMMKSDAYPFQTHNETWEPGIYNWYFAYTGSGEIKDREVTQIEVNYYVKDDRIDRPTTICFKFSNLDSFTLTENVQYEAEGEVLLPPFITDFYASITAEQAKANTATMQSSNFSDSSNSSSGGSSTPKANMDLYDARVKCGLCDNGDCKTCGGDGYLWSSASDKEDRNCYKCNRGNCRNCGGDGWLD